MKKKSMLITLLVMVSFVFTMRVSAASISCTPTSVYVNEYVTCTVSGVDEEDMVSLTTSLNRVSGKTAITKDDVDAGNNTVVYSASSTGTYDVTATANGWTDTVKIKVSQRTTSTTTTTTQAKSNNAYLSTITIDGDEIDDFSRGTTTYYVDVENSVTKISISAKAEDASSSVSVDGPNSLSVGKNEYTITVTAEDSSVKTYKIYVTRLEEDQEDSPTKIENIKIKGYKLNFNSSSKTFYLKIDKDDTELDITVTLADDTSTYEIEGNEDLEDGSIIRIIVTAADGETSDTYRIIIEKTDTNYVPFIIGGVVLLIIILIIIFIIIKKKKNKDKNNKQTKKVSNKQKNTNDSVDTSLEKTKQMPPISDNTFSDATLTDNVSDDEDDDVIHVDNDEEEKTRILSYAEKQELKRIQEESDFDEELGKTMIFNDSEDDDE